MEEEEHCHIVQSSPNCPNLYTWHSFFFHCRLFAISNLHTLIKVGKKCRGVERDQISFSGLLSIKSRNVRQGQYWPYGTLLSCKVSLLKHPTMICYWQCINGGGITPFMDSFPGALKELKHKKPSGYEFVSSQVGRVEGIYKIRWACHPII